jgi:hypothetical protein
MAPYAYSLDNDLRAVTAMAAGLVPYVYEDELYGTMPGSLPRLTVGGLLMRMHRLHALDSTLTDAQRQIVTTAQAQLDKTRTEWAVALEGKVSRELIARLRALSQLVSDCFDVRQCSEVYPSEIEKRVMVAALQTEAQASGVLAPEVVTQTANIDSRLKQFTKPGNFLWDTRLEAVYPRATFWYLYVNVGRG